jgi:FtsP/CotA-like multicopper oxidase with cupredoxin domain
MAGHKSVAVDRGRQALPPGDDDKSGDNHPVHLHRHTFEVTKVGDKTTSGVIKDTINMTRFSSVEIDFVADDPGPSLLHCHHQDHQDEGFMGLVTYI